MLDQSEKPSASTRFALVNHSLEYLILEPAGGGEPFTVESPAGRYAAEWFDLGRRIVLDPAPIEVTTEGPHAFAAPFADAPAVVYLWKVGP